MKKLLPLIIVIFLLIGFVINTGSQESPISEAQPKEEEVTHEPNYVKVKYREDLVDIAHPRFEYLDTSRSSFVRGAWYDEDNIYMVIKLKETYYHYCGMPKNIWSSFKMADSFGTFYNIYIKGHYDCRINYVPEY